MLCRVSPKSGESWKFAGAQSTPRGLPSAPTIVERLMPLSPIHRASARVLAATRSLCDAAVHRDIGELKANGLVVGFERHTLQSVHHRPASTHSRHAFLGAAWLPNTSCRLSARVGAAEDQHFTPSFSITYRVCGPMVAKGLFHFSFAQQGTNLLRENRLDDVWLDCGHGRTSSPGSLSNWPDDQAYRARLTSRCAALLAQPLTALA